MNRIKVLFCFFVLLLSVTIFQSNVTYAEENKRLNIITKENKVLFKLNNLKPGDWATRDLIVQNRSDSDFTYTTDAIFISGSEELYNEFILEISDGAEVLFKGNLRDFEKLSPRFLKAKYEEELIFRVDFPNHLGNEFQGKAFEVQFRFYINDAPPNPDPEDPNPEPENPTNPDPEDPNPGDPNDNENPDPDPEDPETPDSPDESGNPPVPGDSDSDDPKNPDQGEGGPQRPIPSDRIDAPPTDGEILPATATNMFNYILAGVLLIASGIVLLLIAKRRRQLV